MSMVTWLLKTARPRLGPQSHGTAAHNSDWAVDRHANAEFHHRGRGMKLRGPKAPQALALLARIVCVSSAVNLSPGNTLRRAWRQPSPSERGAAEPSYRFDICLQASFIRAISPRRFTCVGVAFVSAQGQILAAYHKLRYPSRARPSIKRVRQVKTTLIFFLAGPRESKRISSPR